MMRVNTTEISCGVNQISEIAYNPPARVLRFIQDDHFTGQDQSEDGEYIDGAPICAYYLFSDTVHSGAGKRLADFIKKAKIGTVSSSVQRRNPNSGNIIQAFMWAVNQENFRAWKPGKKA